MPIKPSTTELTSTRDHQGHANKTPLTVTHTAIPLQWGDHECNLPGTTKSLKDISQLDGIVHLEDYIDQLK